MLPVPVITHLSLKAGRALRKLKKLGLPTLEHSIAILPDRAILLYPVNSLNSLEWGIKEQYKEKEYFLLEDYKPKEGDVIMDVGANLGLSTLIYSNLAGEDGFVIAIEPVPDIYALLALAVGSLFLIKKLRIRTF